MTLFTGTEGRSRDLKKERGKRKRGSDLKVHIWTTIGTRESTFLD